MKIKSLKFYTVACITAGAILITSATYSQIKKYDEKGNLSSENNNDIENEELYVLTKFLALPKYQAENHTTPYDGIRYSTTEFNDYSSNENIYISPIYVISKNKDVDGWTCAGTYNPTINNAPVYIFEYIGSKDIELPGRHKEVINRDNNLVFTNSHDINQFAKNTANYRFYGLVDEDLYDKFGLSIADKIIINELSEKTK